VIVYSVEKTGTQTIYYTLKSLQLRDPVYHTHYLTTVAINRIVAGPKTHRKQTKLNEISKLKQRVRFGRHKHWRIITLVRNPIARSISALFHIYKKYEPNWDVGNIPAETVKDLQNHYARKVDNYISQMAKWFEDELQQFFGIDVYAQPFPHEQGYMILRSRRADVLVIRLENLNVCYRQAFSEFMDIDIPQLEHHNRSEDKGYREIYKRFKEEALLPGWAVEEMCSLRYTQHFYTPQEIERFRSAWKTAPDAPRE
nr:sulfotransferase family 2 domain-containing protein [Anaerolineae bacterium]